MKNHQFLILAALIVLVVTACNGSTVTPTPVAAGVVIVTVNQSEQYVEIRNDSHRSENLTDWYLSLGRRTTCRLGGEIHIQSGETLRIWAMTRDAGKGGYNCGLDQPFWSSKEPKRIFLYDAGGDLVDKYFAGGE